MFFDFIKRNSSKTRKENGVYFASLVISIVAFYVILSLGEQDVMIYLKTIESNAVARLLLMISMLYVVSLFFVFFLVYFANRYQLQRRSHEFGIYLMMGMKSSRLFAMIMGETLWNGLIALLIGIPISLFLTEIISLTTSRLIGMGIIGHQFHISWTGLGLTVLGFIMVQLLAMFILSFMMSKKEPVDLLNEQKEKSQRILSPAWGWISLILGAVLLCAAYVLAILYLHTLDILMFALILFVGISGTFMLFRGLGSFIGRWIRRKSSSSTGLFTFTGRQLQENVLHQSSSLAISSLLILLAMVCFAFGISTILIRGGASGRTADFTFEGSEKEIVSVLTSDKLKPYIKDYYPMKLGNLKTETLSWTGLEEAVSKEENSQEKENLLRDLSYQDRPYLIAVSSYNKILEAMNESPIVLGDNEVAIYSNGDFSFSHGILSKVLETNPTIDIDEKTYKLTSTLYTSNLVADRAITLSYGLIVPDDMYNGLTGNSEESLLLNEESVFLNMVLDPDFVREKGLMQAMYKVDDLLNTSGLKYESYLASMGRQLFYIIAGSYTTLYLGVMFLIIANTVLGLKFLMQQRSTRHRYSTLFMLGASVKSLCSSAKTQIWWYFGLVIAVALISSIFGVWSMIEAFIVIPKEANSSSIILLAGIALIIFIAFELCYIWMIQRNSDEEIRKLKEI
ncbi:ftsX-like permease family protein [Clostridium argentinense CDC 2741]|uniref:FtsX-like permease family protein n=2 Tax=Clostridium argentinense TaxID=29341 RepID=A0A0C1R3B2_9CLOT|nr:ABC transporter permease [Clostridium argentinense]KIE47982.1 ftsX-like permease family protein [Clostridium argentinense CDC 2741]NFF40386.1 ABC transporter permease [Clostridium argentinense]NFP50193.1 ABC transporter permease [Clostridium argentinense]NFP72708.1 ABC transporter permease [Clostridium argentinense]